MNAHDEAKLAKVKAMSTDAIQSIVDTPRPAHAEGPSSTEFPLAGLVQIEGIGHVPLTTLRAELASRQ